MERLSRWCLYSTLVLIDGDILQNPEAHARGCIWESAKVHSRACSAFGPRKASYKLTPIGLYSPNVDLLRLLLLRV